MTHVCRIPDCMPRGQSQLVLLLLLLLPKVSICTLSCFCGLCRQNDAARRKTQQILLTVLDPDEGGAVKVPLLKPNVLLGTDGLPVPHL